MAFASHSATDVLSFGVVFYGHLICIVTRYAVACVFLIVPRCYPHGRQRACVVLSCNVVSCMVLFFSLQCLAFTSPLPSMWCTVMFCIVRWSDLLRCYDWFCYCSALSPSLSLSIVIPTLTVGVKARCRVLSCRRLYSIVELRYVVRAPSPCASREMFCDKLSCVMLSYALLSCRILTAFTPASCEGSSALFCSRLLCAVFCKFEPSSVVV